MLSSKPRLLRAHQVPEVSESSVPDPEDQWDLGWDRNSGGA